MNLHSKARTCPASRGLIAKRMLKGAWSEDQAVPSLVVRTSRKETDSSVGPQLKMYEM